jgi:hypothetical protein
VRHERRGDRVLDPFRRQRLAVERERPVRPFGPAQEVAGRIHPRLGGALGAADPIDLGAVLDPAALDEKLALRRELDAVRTQVVGQLQREGGRDNRLLDAHLLDCTQRDLQRDLPVLLAGLRQLVEAERNRRDQRGIDARVLDPRPLEVRDHDVAAAVLLHVEEGIAECERHLVAELGVPNCVAVHEYVGHAADSNEASAALARGEGMLDSGTMTP